MKKFSAFCFSPKLLIWACRTAVFFFSCAVFVLLFALLALVCESAAIAEAVLFPFFDF